MKIYISGPMTGIPDYNFPAFNAAEKALLGYGVNPAKNGLPLGLPWATYLRADLKVLLECDAVLQLPGWMDSHGARLECFVADALGMPSFTSTEDALAFAQGGKIGRA
jgi:hypothetical protein